MNLRYERTQSGTLIWWMVVPVLVFSLGLVGFRLVAVPGAGAWITLAVAGVMLAVLVAFRSLTITVDDHEVTFYFGPGVHRRRFALTDIVQVRAVRNRWYYGWGIRLTPHGWLYNVSGLDAIELTLKSGIRLRIGTDDPAEVLQAIEEARLRAGVH